MSQFIGGKYVRKSPATNFVTITQATKPKPDSYLNFQQNNSIPQKQTTTTSKYVGVNDRGSNSKEIEKITIPLSNYSKTLFNELESFTDKFYVSKTQAQKSLDLLPSGSSEKVKSFLNSIIISYYTSFSFEKELTQLKEKIKLISQSGTLDPSSMINHMNNKYLQDVIRLTNDRKIMEEVILFKFIPSDTSSIAVTNMTKNGVAILQKIISLNKQVTSINTKPPILTKNSSVYLQRDIVTELQNIMKGTYRSESSKLKTTSQSQSLIGIFDKLMKEWNQKSASTNMKQFQLCKKYAQELLMRQVEFKQNLIDKIISQIKERGQIDETTEKSYRNAYKKNDLLKLLDIFNDNIKLKIKVISQHSINSSPENQVKFSRNSANSIKSIRSANSSKEIPNFNSQNQIQTKGKQLQLINNQIRLASEELIGLNKQLNDANVHNNVKIRDRKILQQQIKQKQSQKIGFLQDLQNINKLLSERQLQNQKLINQKERITKQIKQTGEKRTNTSYLYSRYSNNNSENDKKINELNLKNSNLTAEIQRLKENQAKLMAKLKRFEDLQNKKSTSFQKQQLQKKQIISNNQQLKQKIINLTDELSNLQFSHNQLNKKVKQLNLDIIKYKNQIEALKKNQMRFQQAIKQKEEKQRKLINQKNQINLKNNQLLQEKTANQQEKYRQTNAKSNQLKLSNQNSQKSKKILLLQSELSEAKKNFQQQKSLKTENEKNILQHKKRILELQKELDLKSKQFVSEQQKFRKTETQAINQNIYTIQTQGARLQNQNKYLRQNNQLRVKLQNYQNNKKQMEQQLKRLNFVLDQEANKINLIQNDRAQLTTKNSEINQNYNNLVRVNDANISNIKSLQNQNRNLQNKNQKLISQNKDLAIKMSDLTKLKEQLNIKLNSQQRQTQPMASKILVSRIGGSSQNINSLRQLASLKQVNKQHQVNIKQKQEFIAELLEQIQTLKNNDDSMEKLQIQIKQKQTLIFSLQKQISELKQFQKEYYQISKSHDELENQVKKYQDKIKELTNSLNQKNKFSSYTSSFEKREINEVQNKLKIADETNRTLQRKNKQTQSKISTIILQNNRLKDNIKTLQKQLSEKDLILKQQMTLLQKNKKESSQALSPIKELNNKRENAEKQLKDFKAKYALLSDQKYKLEKLVENKQQSIGDLNREYKKLKDDNERQIKQLKLKNEETNRYTRTSASSISSVSSIKITQELNQVKKQNIRLQNQLNSNKAKSQQTNKSFENQIKIKTQEHEKAIKNLNQKFIAKSTELQKISKELQGIKLQKTKYSIQSTIKNQNSKEQQLKKKIFELQTQLSKLRNQSTNGALNNQSQQSPQISMGNNQQFQKIFCNTLFQNMVLQGQIDHKIFFKKSIEQHMKQSIQRTRLIFSYDTKNATNFHNYIDKKQNLALLIKMKNGYYIGAFSESKFQSGELPKKTGLIVSLTNKQVFKLVEQNKKAITYDDFYIIIGNSELRIKSMDNKLFSNFGISNGSYHPRGQKVSILLGGAVNKRQQEMEHYEVYEVVFKNN